MRDIEKTTKQSLSFVEQLQNQIQLCREAMSDYTTPLTPKIETLESLLWAKLKEDKDYLESIEKIEGDFKKRKKQLKEGNPQMYEWKFDKLVTSLMRDRAKEKFKAIMVFIDKKNLMPIGEY